VVFAPNLKWPEFNLKDPLEKATGLSLSTVAMILQEHFGFGLDCLESAGRCPGRASGRQG